MNAEHGWSAVPRDQLRVVAAAVKHPDGRVFTVPPPGRHASVLWMMVAMGCMPANNALGGVQGFILNSGQFARRKAAAAVALRNGQVAALRWPPNLFSEDLW